MDMDNAELKDLRELKAIKELYGWTDETRDYKVRLKAIQKKYSQLAKAESKSKGGKVISRRPASRDEEDGVGLQGWLQGGAHRCRGVG